MKEFFYPNSVVIVGVSTSGAGYGSIVIKNLQSFGFSGQIFGVGRQSGIVNGVQIYPSIADLPEPPEIAIVLTPAQSVPAVIRECGEKGTKFAIIMTAGFAEFGGEEQSLQKELVETAKRYGIQFIGPNCIGVICPESGFVAPFAPLVPGIIRHGSFSVLCQSGTYTLVAAKSVTSAGVGVAKVVSIGNKLNIGEVDLLPYLMYEDEQTSIIGLYLEGMSRGREFISLAQNSPKPIVALKANISPQMSEAARSHTASLASDDRIVDAAFRQAGIIRVKEIRSFATAAKALKLPLLRGKKLGVASNTGGVSVVASDWCFENGFTLPPLPENVIEKLRQRSAAGVINYANPLDLVDIRGVEATLFALEQLVSLPAIDGVIFSPLYPGASPTVDEDVCAVIEGVRKLMLRFDKPIAMIYEDVEATIVQHLREISGFPLFDSVNEALAGFGMLYQYTCYKIQTHEAPEPLAVAKDGASKLITTARGDGLRDIGPAAMSVLEAYGLPTAMLHFAASPDEAAIKADQVGYPVVMKAVARNLSHKSDVGGVVLGLASPEAVRGAFQDIQTNLRNNMPEANFLGVVIQRMVSSGHELILGAKRDPHFGPVVMVGMGGVFTEVFEDVAFRLAPLSHQVAEEMLSEIKAAKILKGMRGQPPADIPALVEALVRLGQLISDFEEITEIDVNPLKVFPAGQGAVAVDARIVLT